MLKRVLIKGPLLSQSGYGVHARQVFSALLKRKDIVLHTAITEWGLTTILLKDQDDSDIIRKIVELSNFDKSVVFDESFQICAPFSWNNKEAKINIGLTAGFESNFVKKEWIDFSNKMDYLIFPSEFTQKAFYNTSNKFNMPIRPKSFIINESYFKEFDNEKINVDFLEKLESSLHYDKNILIIGQLNNENNLSDRKNIIKTIKTAAKYVDDKDIGILLKINSGRYTQFFKQKLIFYIKNMLDKKERRKIKFIFGNLSKNEMYNLYTCKKISCMFVLNVKTPENSCTRKHRSHFLEVKLHISVTALIARTRRQTGTDLSYQTGMGAPCCTSCCTCRVITCPWMI